MKIEGARVKNEMKAVEILPNAMFATIGNFTADHTNWIIEPHKKGLRVIIIISEKEIKFLSAKKNEIPFKNVEILNELKTTKDKLILDAILCHPNTILNYDRINNIISEEEWGKTKCILLDILQINKHDVRNLPLVIRKELMAEIFNKYKWKQIQQIQYAISEEKNFTHQSYTLQKVGGIAKNKLSLYDSGTKSKHWIKIRPYLLDTAHVIGISYNEDKEESFHGLILGYPENKIWKYVGECSNGLTAYQKEKLLPQIITHYSKFSALTKPINTTRKIKWVNPIIRIKYSFEYQPKTEKRKKIFFRSIDESNQK